MEPIGAEAPMGRPAQPEELGMKGNTGRLGEPARMLLTQYTHGLCREQCNSSPARTFAHVTVTLCSS